MRSVADALNVSAAGLYRYLASRDELIGHMVDTLSAGIPHPAPTGDWVADLTFVAGQQRGLFREHPWLVIAVGSLRHLGPHVLDHLDWGLDVLRDVPVPTRDKMEALALINGVAALFATAGSPAGPEAFATLDPQRHSHLVAALTDASSSPPAMEDLFERVVASLLDSLLRTETPSS